MTNAYLLPLLYAGLGGVVLALIVATATNRWSCRVFFILALRLAIGWHFLFEGLHKVHSHYAGPSETVRPFTSDKYFETARGPLGEVMRQRLGDPAAKIEARLTPQNLPEGLARIPPDARTPDPEAAPFGRRPSGEPVVTWAAFARENPKATVAEYERKRLLDGIADDVAFAAMVPPPVKQEWDGFVAAFAEKYKLDDGLRKKIDGTLDEAEKAELVERADLEKRYAGLKDGPEKEKVGERLEALALAGDLGVDSLAVYGRWIAGVEPQPSQVKYVSGDTPLTAPQRREYIDRRQAELDALARRAEADLGNGYGHERARVADMSALVSLARSTLLSDAAALLADQKSAAFAAVMTDRTARRAPLPSKVLEDGAKFDAVLPPAEAPGQPTFDAVPADVRGMWDAYYTAVKAEYPVGEPADLAARLDDVYANLKTRFAAWYYGRDPFTNQPADGFATLAETYRAAQQRAADLKAQAEAGLPAFHLAFARAAQAEARAEAENTRQAMIAALDLKYNELTKALTDKSVMPEEVTTGPVSAPEEPSPLKDADWLTRWALTAIGAMLLIGLFTRVACVLGGVFLVMTYLAHPPFPWLPQPPATEGNPIFINKNVIEFLGLMVILVHPTGRWLGLDALIHRLVFRNSPEYTNTPARG